jgi:hypothetical protein
MLRRKAYQRGDDAKSDGLPAARIGVERQGLERGFNATQRPNPAPVQV